MCPRRGSALLLGTQFERMEMFCVYAGDGSKVIFKTCKCVDSAQGVVITSTTKDASTVNLNWSRMLNCKVGLKVGNGRVAVILNSMHYDNCDVGTCCKRYRYY